MINTTNLSDTNPENWTEKEINYWFENGKWREGWTAKPDASINKRTLAIEYHKNPLHWKQAFKFLKESDLKNLPEGKQELDGKNLFVGIDKYYTKEMNQTKYEAHKKYIDIQYVISGEEQMGITTLDKVAILEAYNPEKDLVFYSFEGGNYIKANHENFLIF